MKQHIKYALKLLGERVFFNFLTLIMLPVFIPIIGTFSDSETFSGVGSVIYSVMVCSLYLGIGFDSIWKMGKHDRQPYATEKHYRLKGLTVGLMAEIPFFLFYLLLLLNNGTVAFYRVFCIGTYMGFLPAALPGGAGRGLVLAGYGLVLLIMPFLSMLAYMAGYKKPKEEKEKASYKIMYKKKEE